MSRDIPASIAKEFVDAVDALEIIDGDPPTISECDRYFFLKAIRQIDGPFVDAEAKLQMMLNALGQMANALRTKQR